MRITKSLNKVRNEILYNTWKERKSELTMKEIAIIFKITTAQCYTILKVEREKKLFEKFTKKNEKIDSKK